MTMLCNAGVAGASGVDTGDIPASLRFRSAASAYLNRTFGAPTDNKKWTWSGWVKRGALPAAAYNLLSGGSGGSNDASLMLDGNGSLWLYYWTGSYVFSLTAAAFSRDPTSHVHLVVSYDSTQAQTGHSASDSRVRFYLNGVQVSSAGTLPSQNYASNQINAAVGHRLGYSVASSYPFDGYLSRVCFVDGQALTPSSFGYLNTEINEWVSKSQSAVKAVVDAGGVNSFMLDFDDATSLTTLGYDKSSKGNNWTLNNFSLTAGTSYDRMLDVPGNSFPTFNAIEYAVNTFSDCNLKCVTSAGGSYTSGCTQFFPATGKWYAEVTDTTEANTQIGIVAAGYSGLTQLANQPSGYSYYATSGNKYNNGVSGAYGATYTTGDVIGIIFDADAGKLYFSKNGTVQNSGDPAAGTGFAYSGLTGTYCVAVGDGGVSAATLNLNCGQAPLHASATYHSAAGGYFRYAPPTGYKALCQRNMPDPAILNPELHFDVGLVTGNASVDQTITTLFAPDALISKARNAAIDWGWFSKMIGGDKYLSSNTTAAETTSAANTVTFNSTGVSLKAGGSIINDATRTYVDLLLKAGGAPVTNNAGSISSQVSANVEAGFSIVTYTGTGANATVGHGLGVAPKLVIVKQRNGSTYSWTVHHDALSAGQVLFLEANAAATARATSFNSTDPSSTVFSLGTDLGTNANGNTYVAYCFAEIAGFSKIFSYTGNGSADGPFVHCGFKPKYALIKQTTAASATSWATYDSVRGNINTIDEVLYSNLSGAEGSGTGVIDFVSSGFKLRYASDTNVNASGGTYIGIAFADVSAKFSLGR